MGTYPSTYLEKNIKILQTQFPPPWFHHNDTNDLHIFACELCTQRAGRLSDMFANIGAGSFRSVFLAASWEACALMCTKVQDERIVDLSCFR